MKIKSFCDDYDDNIFRTGDFDGDGGTDILKLGSDGKAWIRYESDTFASWNGLGSYGKYSKNKFYTGDFDGDGLTDVLKVGTDEIAHINYATDGLSDSWDFKQRSFCGDYDDNIFRIGDFDGDGEDDILKLGSDGKAWIKYASGSFASWNGLGSYGKYSKNKFYTGDFDGDGLTDVLKVGSDEIAHINYATDGLSDSWDLKKKSFCDDYNDNIFLTGDFDGDGDDDVIKIGDDSKGWIRYASENFHTWHYIRKLGTCDSDTNHFYIGDFNADGVNDIVKIGSDEIASFDYN